MKNVFIFVVSFILSGLFICYLYENKRENGINYLKEYEVLQYRFDSIQKELNLLENQLTRQREKTDSIQILREKEKAKQIEIRNKYEKIINNLNSMPVNDRIEFFSVWLSEKDSIAN